MEVARLAELAVDALGERDGLATLERSIRTAMAKLGATPPSSKGCSRPTADTAVSASIAEQATRQEFVGYRPRTLDTVLGPITLRRAYYRCRECAHGVVPRDEALGVTSASLSPGLRAMVAPVGREYALATRPYWSGASNSRTSSPLATTWPRTVTEMGSLAPV